MKFDESLKEKNLFPTFKGAFVGEYAPHETRILNEAMELSEKAEKLIDFIENNEIFETLDDINQNLLRDQLVFMRYYLGTLVARLTLIDLKYAEGTMQ